MRVGEIENLLPEDIDLPRSRLRLSRATTKGRKSRWIDVPPWLMALLPLDAFPWFDQAAQRSELYRAADRAGVARFKPHDLRHRRISLWFRAGLDPIEIAARAGHSRPSMSMDVYAHVLVDDREVDWTALLGA